MRIAQINPYNLNFGTYRKDATTEEKRMVDLRQRIRKDIYQKQVEQRRSKWELDANNSFENRQKYETACENRQHPFNNTKLYNSAKKLVDNPNIRNLQLEIDLSNYCKKYETSQNQIKPSNPSSRSSPSILDTIKTKEIDLESKIYNFQYVIDGEKRSQVEIKNILFNSTDVELRKKAYEQELKRADLVSAELIEIVKLRNEFAEKKGYRNYFEYELGGGFNAERI